MKAPSPRSGPAEPAEAIDRHLGSRGKQLRAGRGWSLDALANASGVSRSMLSQIEREEANLTLAVTLRIARAFGFSLGELLEMPGAASAVTIIRADDHTFHYRSDKDFQIRTLSPLNLEKDVVKGSVPQNVRFPPNAVRTSEMDRQAEAHPGWKGRKGLLGPRNFEQPSEQVTLPAHGPPHQDVASDDT